MKIAYLGWGSLVWSPCELSVTGSWEQDGPSLPIEFGRISHGRRLTLVLVPLANDVRTLWVRAANTDLKKAIDNLAEREQTTEDNVGFVSLRDNKSRCNTVPQVLHKTVLWARDKMLDAAIWTDLPSNFKEKTGMDLDEDNVITYMRGLDHDSQKRAEEYVRRAPAQIDTRIRRKLQEIFMWGHRSMPRA